MNQMHSSPVLYGPAFGIRSEMVENIKDGITRPAVQYCHPRWPVRSLGGESNPLLGTHAKGERPRVLALKGSIVLFLLPLLYGKTVSVKYFETLIKE